MAWAALYLDPPHSHDASLVYSLIYIEKHLWAGFPIAVQLCVKALQESTSILYASFSRLSQLQVECPSSWNRRYGMNLILVHQLHDSPMLKTWDRAV